MSMRTYSDAPFPGPTGRPALSPAVSASAAGRPASGRPASRRSFLGGSLAAAAAAAMPAVGRGFVAGDQRLRVGLVGCGGRGTGAALQAAAADPAVRVVALGDLFAEQVASAADLLARGIGGQFDCPAARRFVGEQAFRGVIESDVDLVLLTATPQTRPLHLEAAIAAGRHVYCEKPVAIDVAGVVRAAAAAARGRAAGLSLASGLCFRHDTAMCDLVARVHGGEIGRPLSVRAHAAVGLPWRKPAVVGDTADAWRQRNWISFAGLSGGHFVEHHVEAIDRALWLLGDVAPCSAEPLDSALLQSALLDSATSGGDAAGAIGDCAASTAVLYRFVDGTTLEASLDRRERGLDSRVETVAGSGGTCDLVRGAIGGGVVSGLPGGPGRHQAAMDALVRAVLAGRVVHEGATMCLSSMVAVMGRAATEAGHRVTWADFTGMALPSA